MPQAAACSFHPEIGRRVRADRALAKQIGELAGGAGTMVWHEQTIWASASFQGSRHKMAWLFEGAAAIAAGEALIDALAKHDFSIPGHVVADVAVTAVDLRVGEVMTVDLELLLLEDERR